MLRIFRLATCGCVLASVIAAPRAEGQFGVTAVGVAEWDTNETFLLLAGLSASPGGMGLAPVFGITAHNVSFDAGTDRESIFSFRPFVGLRNTGATGSVEGTIGYAFTNRDEPVVVVGQPAVAVDRGEGLVTTLHLEHWGSGGPLASQLIGSYNFGSDAFWGRGRVTTRANPVGTLRLGGELAYYTDDDFNVWQPGVLVELRPGAGAPQAGPIFGFGVGRKFANEGDDATYFKVEVVLPLNR